MASEKLKNANKELEKKVNDAVKEYAQVEEKLHESEKLASMGEMLANIAHQWRQPLSIISISATGIKMQKEYDMLDDEKLLTAMDNINDTAQYLSRTIDDFRNFLKGDHGEKELFNISAYIEKTLRILEAVIKQNNIQVIQNLDESIELKSFAQGFVQSIINIINNAIDAIKENVEDEDNRYIFIDCKKEDDQVIVTIKDNAGGIPEDIIDKVFEPYFTTKHKSQGTGLGLHMTYRIINENIKGSIDAKNETFQYNDKNYKGALFIIIIPLLENE